MKRDQFDREEKVNRRQAIKSCMGWLSGLGIATLVLLLPSGKAHAGYGRCWKCSCKAFEGTSYQCDNCGHQFTDHGEL